MAGDDQDERRKRRDKKNEERLERLKKRREERRKKREERRQARARRRSDDESQDDGESESPDEGSEEESQAAEEEPEDTAAAEEEVQDQADQAQKGSEPDESNGQAAEGSDAQQEAPAEEEWPDAPPPPQAGTRSKKRKKRKKDRKPRRPEKRKPPGRPPKGHIDGWLFRTPHPPDGGIQVSQISGPVLDKERGARPIMSIKRLPVDAGGATDEERARNHMKSYLLELAQTLPRFAPVDVWTGEVQGRPAHLVGNVYKGRGLHHGTIFRQLRLIVLDGEDAVELCGTARAELWEEAASMFETFVATIAFDPNEEAGLVERRRLHPVGASDGPPVTPARTAEEAREDKATRLALGLPPQEEKDSTGQPMRPGVTGTARRRLENWLRYTKSGKAPEMVEDEEGFLVHEHRHEHEGQRKQQVLDRWVDKTKPGQSEPRIPELEDEEDEPPGGSGGGGEDDQEKPEKKTKTDERLDRWNRKTGM